MNVNSATKEDLAAQYAQLWVATDNVPDVFAFLSSHADVLSIDRLDVLLVDQRERWRREKRCRFEFI